MNPVSRGIVPGLFAALALHAAVAAEPVPVRWEGSSAFPRAEWERRIGRFAPASPGARLPILVKVAPDVERQSSDDGDAAFATWSVRHHRVEIHVAADVPSDPDLLSPALASARFLAAYPGAEPLSLLVAGFGAHRAGTWWGRPSVEWAPLLKEAGVLPAAEDLSSRSGRATSPTLLDVGAAASALDAWSLAEGEEALEKELGSGAPSAEKLRRYLAAAAAAAPPHPLPARALPHGVLRGVSLAMENSVDGSYLSRRSAETLERLKRDGANAVSLMPYAFERSPSGPELRFPGRNPRGETEESVLRAAQDAHRRGMLVLVKPQIWLWRGFTGDIAMKSEADWASWFRNYLRYLLRFAAVAEASRADLFDVGVELGGTEKRTREWRSAIRAVRLATGAPLLYSCNWGKGAESVPFWDALDAIGVDFYDPLSSSSLPEDAELVEGVRHAALPLARLAARSGKPVFFTEVGFPSVAGAWISPHDEGSPRPFSGGDAARCARAVFAAVSDAPWFRGLFWWKAFSSGEDAEAGAKTFNILGRPIEGVIREGFRKMEAGEGGRIPTGRTPARPGT